MGLTSTTAQVRHRATAPARRTQIGRLFEQQILGTLESRGMIIVGTNVRFGRDEVDILALDGTTCVIVEVRGRTNETTDTVLIHTAANKRKLRFLRRVALKVLQRYPEHQGLRVDLAVVGYDGVDLLENAIDFSLP